MNKIYLILWESYGPKLPYFLKYRQYYAHLLPEVGRPIIILHKVKHGYFQKTENCEMRSCYIHQNMVFWHLTVETPYIVLSWNGVCWFEKSCVKKLCVGVWTGYLLQYCLGRCEWGNEFLCHMKGSRFHDWLSDCFLLKMQHGIGWICNHSVLLFMWLVLLLGCRGCLCGKMMMNLLMSMATYVI